MDQALVSEIASESQPDRLLREQNQKRLVVLQAGLGICNAHVERKASSNPCFHIRALYISAADIHSGREKIPKSSHTYLSTPTKVPAANDADCSMEEEVCLPSAYR